MVKISKAIDMSCNILKETVERPRMEAEILAAYVFGKTKLELLTHKDDCVVEEMADKLNELSLKRSSGMPLAYITGTKEFMSLEFCVNENVLIPRPETEELAGLIIDIFKDKNIKLLDLCTGSGAICSSVAYYLKNSICHGVDVCPEAIDIAKFNAKKLGVSERTRFFVGDVLKTINIDEKYDVLVSNPPYIETDVIETLDVCVKDYEPRLALDGGNDGLLFYRKIIKDANKYIKPKGLLLFEIGYNQGDEIKKLLQKDFCNIKILKDLSGNDRIAYAVLG